MGFIMGVWGWFRMLWWVLKWGFGMLEGGCGVCLGVLEVVMVGFDQGVPIVGPNRHIFSIENS